MSKETIFYQLKMLFKLVQLTDPCFAQYLGNLLFNLIFKLSIQDYHFN